MIETDEVLYSRFLAERSEDDFRILLERHKESMILFLNGYVHNMEDAEELMLDAYAQVAAGTKAFLGRSSFKTWLFSIGKKMALMHLRKEKRRPDATTGRIRKSCTRCCAVCSSRTSRSPSPVRSR